MFYQISIISLLYVHFVLSSVDLPLSPGGAQQTYIKMFLEPSDEPYEIMRELYFLRYNPLKYSPEDNSILLVASAYELLSITYSRFLLETQKDPPKPLDVSVSGPYKDLSTILTIMRDICDQHEEICEFIDVVDEFDGRLTFEGRTIHALKFTSPDVPERDKHNILVVGCHHAREVVTPETVLSIIYAITENYGSDESFTKLLKENQVFLIPVVNVDGYSWVFEGNQFWRKNRNISSKYGDNHHHYMDEFGVDLNRNYNYRWDLKEGVHKEIGNDCLDIASIILTDLPFSNTYCGSEPFSEAETFNIMQMTKQLNFAKVLDFHSYSKVIFSSTKGACEKFHVDIDRMMRDYLTDACDLIPDDDYICEPWDMYGVIGTNTQYQHVESTHFNFLYEIGVEFIPHYDISMEEIEKIYPSIKYFLDAPIPISGTVMAEFSTERLDVFIQVLDEGRNQMFLMNETRRSGKNGLFHLFVPEGTYYLEFFADGYATKTIDVEYTKGNPVLIVDLKMEKIDKYFNIYSMVIAIAAIVIAVAIVLIVLGLTLLKFLFPEFMKKKAIPVETEKEIEL